MEPFLLENESFLLLRDWMDSNPRLIAGFTTKHGGYSKGPYTSLNMAFHVNDESDAVRLNRQKVGRELDFSVHHWVGAEQIHDAVIRKVSKSDTGKGALSYEDAIKGTDGFFTLDKGVLLTLCFADCVPVYFFSPRHGAVGIAHAGWRGTVKGIAAEMIRVFQEEKIPPRDIFVVIGPSICEKCYIVDDKVIEIVKSRLAEGEKKTYNFIYGNQYTLNLQEANKQILMQAKVPEQNIRITNFCTGHHHNLFFSHRRDKGKTGRMMGFIGWKED
ncbi:MAG: peptidoglycan editing factor PgeF [Bacillales bacterium]